MTIGVGGAVGLGFWGLIRKIDQISKNTVVKHSGEFHVAQSEEKLMKAMEKMHKDMERVWEVLKGFQSKEWRSSWYKIHFRCIFVQQ